MPSIQFRVNSPVTFHDMFQLSTPPWPLRVISTVQPQLVTDSSRKTLPILIYFTNLMVMLTRIFTRLSLPSRYHSSLKTWMKQRSSTAIVPAKLLTYVVWLWVCSSTITLSPNVHSQAEYTFVLPAPLADLCREAFCSTNAVLQQIVQDMSKSSS